MQACLINPPLSVHEFPHLALPLLKGYLQSKGIPCVVRDFNVEIMDGIIFDGFEKIQRYFFERGIYYSLKELRTRYQEARQVFHSDAPVGQKDRAQKHINTYLHIAGSHIFDICFRPDSLDTIKEGYATCDVEKENNRIIRFIREEIIPWVREHPADVIGISVPFTSQIFYALILGREIKKWLPEARVVMGGPQISLFWRLFIRHKPFRQAFDALIIGMGEIAMEAFIRAVDGKTDWSAVPNLVYPDDSGETVVNPQKEIRDMQEIPLPDFSDLPLEKYVYAKLPYQFSRGCYWGKCAFCSYRDKKGYVTRKIDVVLDHLQEMERRYGIHSFQFIDDAIHPQLLDRMAREILNRGMRIRYDAYLRLEAGFTEEVCLRLRRSGLHTVLFGFESANQRLLNLMNKGNTPQNMLCVLKNMHNAGVQSILSCLIGFPTETREEAWDSIRFLRDNRRYFYWAYIVHFGMISDMRSHSADYGVTDLDETKLIRYDDSGFVALGYPYRTTCGMSVEEALETIKEGRQALGIQIFHDNFFS